MNLRVTLDSTPLMLSIKSHKGSFQVRAAAIIQKEKSVLLLNEPLAGPYWFLPGGRAEMQESTDEALVRELQEEIQETLSLGKLLFVLENFFTLNQVNHHTIGFYYQAFLPMVHPLCSRAEFFTEREEEGVVKTFHFRWHPLSELSAVDLRPPFLQEILPTLMGESALRHCVVRESMGSLL